MSAVAQAAGKRRWWWALVAVVLAMLVLLVVAGSAALGVHPVQLMLAKGHVAVETVIGETPQRRVAQYFAALRDGDRERALSVWSLAENAPEEMRQRRELVTDELLAMGGDITYTIEGIEWWSTCCEPSPVRDSAVAGLARLHVAVSVGGGGPQHRYTIDVLTAEPYWGAAGGDPVRHWRLRDVYRDGERPLVFRWPVEMAMPAAPQTLSETERDPSQWLTYTSTDWPLTLRYPPGWTVLEFVYAEPDYGPVIRVSTGGRVLEMARRADLPPGPLSPGGSASIGRRGALLSYAGSDVGRRQPSHIVLTPVGAGDAIAYATIELLGTADDDEYLQLFLAVLDSVIFG